MQKFIFSINLKKISTILFKPKTILILIIFLGVFLRVSNLFTNTTFFGDPGRDILVAKHMVEYNGSYLVAPDANGGNVILKNTPFYYWILSFFWLLSGSEFGVIFLFCVVGIFTIIVSYYLSREFSTGLYSLQLPFLVAVSNKFIYFSRNVWQPHLLPIFQMVSLLFLFRGVKKNKKEFLIAIQFAFFTFFIHLSYLSLLLTTIFIIVYFLYVKKQYKKLFEVFLLIIMNIIVWTATSGLSFESKGMNTLFINYDLFNNFIAQSFSILELTLSFITNIEGIPIVISLTLFIVLILFLIFIRRYESLEFKKISLILLLMLSSFFSSSFYDKTIFLHHLIPFYTLIIISCSYLLSYLKNKKIFSGFIMIVIFMFISRGNSYLISRKRISEMGLNNGLSQMIIDSGYKLDDISIGVCTDDGYHCVNVSSFTSSIWFYLEKISNKKLGNIANVGNGNNYVSYSEKKLKTKAFYICRYSLIDCLNDLSLEKKDITTIYIEDELSLFSVD